MLSAFAHVAPLRAARERTTNSNFMKNSGTYDYVMSQRREPALAIGCSNPLTANVNLQLLVLPDIYK
jgi:hypothetical protein